MSDCLQCPSMSAGASLVWKLWQNQDKDHLACFHWVKYCLLGQNNQDIQEYRWRVRQLLNNRIVRLVCCQQSGAFTFFYFLPYITCYWIHNLIIIFLLLKVLYRLCLASGSAGCLSLPLLPEDRGDQGEFGRLSMNDSHFLASFKSLWKINHSNLCNKESSIV